MSKIKVKYGKFTKNSWLVNEKGRRISDKFHLYEEYKLGDFIRLKTSEGYYLYHKKAGLCFGVYEHILLSYITPDLVGIEYNNGLRWRAEIYNLEGELLLNNIDSIREMKNGLFAVRIEGQWGFMNESLNFVIEPLWQKVSDFDEDGHAIVHFKDLKRLAVINKVGEYVCPPCAYTSAEFINEELLRVNTTGSLAILPKYGVITKTGKIIIEPIYKRIILKGDYIIVYDGKYYGLFDTEGNEIFECIYPQIIETDKKFIVHDFAKKEILKVKEQEK